MNQVRIAQIGCGYWGPNLIRSFLSQKDAVMVAVAERSAERRKIIKSQFPSVQVVESPEAALESSDALVIATPAESHYVLAREALKAGKHVLVEKPMARTVHEIDELDRLAVSQKKILMAGHTFLYNNAVREVKRRIVDEEIGDLRYIYSQRLNLGRVRTDVDALWNFAPHDISILQYWTNGKIPEKILQSGMAFLQPGVNDVCFLTLQYPQGPLCHIHVSWLDPVRTRKMVVVGSRKMIVYDDIAEKKIAIHEKSVDIRAILGEKMDYDQFGPSQFKYQDGKIDYPSIPWIEPLQAQARHFLNCIQTGEDPLTGARHAREVVAILQAAQKNTL